MKLRKSVSKRLRTGEPLMADKEEFTPDQVIKVFRCHKCNVALELATEQRFKHPFQMYECPNEDCKTTLLFATEAGKMTIEDTIIFGGRGGSENEADKASYQRSWSQMARRVRVTNTDSSGPGSLREACEMQDKIDQEYIRDGVELADGWDLTHIYAGEDIVSFYALGEPSGPLPDMSFVLQQPTQCGLDALVAQLTRQVDALDSETFVMACDNYSTVKRIHTRLSFVEGPDRTMNSLKAILDSRVLVMT